MSEAPKYGTADLNEVARFKKRIKNSSLAETVQLPDEQWLQPNRSTMHYSLHVTEHTGMTVIDSYNFRHKDAILDAIKYTKSLLKDEQQDSTPAKEESL